MQMQKKKMPNEEEKSMGKQVSGPNSQCSGTHFCSTRIFFQQVLQRFLGRKVNGPNSPFLPHLIVSLTFFSCIQFVLPDSLRLDEMDVLLWLDAC